MAAFYSGGWETHLPIDATLCVYGPTGRLGRAVRDARERAMTSLWASFVVAASAGGLGLAFFSVNASDPIELQLAMALGGLAVGYFMGIGIVATVGIRRVGRRHWIARCHEYRQEQTGAHLASFSAQSRHWHRVLNVRCLVQTPSGITYRASVDGGPYARPGDFLHSTYPSDFPGAPPITQGRYRVWWRTDVEDSASPVTLISRRWTVPDG